MTTHTAKDHPPIVIPESLSTDRSVRHLITQWKHLHLRHRECRKRVAWSNRKASVIEKKRRREKWIVVARILAIEQQLLVWCAKASRDPEIYTPKSGKPKSRLMSLRHRYDANRRIAHHALHYDRKGFQSPTDMRAAYRIRRIVIVSEMRGITRAWMIALYASVYPEGHPPKPIPLHPAELVPRKLKVAQQTITREVS